jgi:hypothetical protein
MAERDPRTNLEFWSDRARAGDHVPRRSQKPYRRSRLDRLPFRVPTLRLPALRIPAFRARPVAAGLLLAGLAGAWLVVGRESHGSAAVVPPVVAPPSAVVATTVSSSLPIAPPRNAIAHAVVTTVRCTGLSVVRPHVRCTADGFIEEVALYTSATVGPAFRKIAGGAAKPHSGPAACATGQPDERAWSLASAPRQAVGRYLCRLEGGRAAMWWTHGDRLWHALTNDADLATLFSQWSEHPSE